MTLEQWQQRLQGLSQSDLLWLIESLDEPSRRALFRSPLSSLLRRRLQLPKNQPPSLNVIDSTLPRAYQRVIASHQKGTSDPSIKPAVSALIITHWERSHG